MRLRRAWPLSLFLLVAPFGCGSTVDPAAGGGGEGASIAQGGDGQGGDGQGGDGQGGNAVEPPQGLFECQVPQVCSMSFHISPDPPDAPNCMAEQATSGLPGAVTITLVPGPYYSVTETLIVYAGDGTALKQSRHKDCMSCDPSTLLWGEPSAIEICDVEIDPAVVAACEAGDMLGCSVWADSTLVDCQPVTTELTCDDVVSILSSEGPACDEELCGPGQGCFDYFTDMSTGTQCRQLDAGCIDCECAVELCTNPQEATCEIAPGGPHVSNCGFAP
jgi:hypothetical protein